VSLRLALLADIHGNLPALEAILEQLEEVSPDGILVAGDWIAGPWGKEVLETLEDHIDTSVLGNTDIRLLDFVDGRTPDSWSTLKQFALARWDASHLDAHHLDLLRGMPEQRVIQPDGTAPIRIVHGSLESPFKGLSVERKPERVEQTFRQLHETVLVCGHTHRPMAIEKDGKLIVNPGAVSGPLNGDIRAQYALLEWHKDHWQALLKTVEYDKRELIKGFENSHLLEEGGALARTFLYTDLTGADITLLFFEHIENISTVHGIDLDSFVPDEIWEEAERTFDWQAVESRRHD
jgi:putative phosphoesterase